MTKSGDSLVIACRSIPALERLLDNPDNQPRMDTAIPELVGSQFDCHCNEWVDAYITQEITEEAN